MSQAQGLAGPSPITCFGPLRRPARIRVIKFKSTAFTHRSSDQPEDVPAGEAPFIVATEERRYLKTNITRSVKHLGDENLKHSK